MSQLLPVFYPSMVVNFRLRFDHNLNVSEDKNVKTETQAGLASQQYGPLVPGPPGTRPLILAGTEDNVSQIASRIPKSGSVELPGYRQAGTFNFTFEYKDLPIDPRLVSACGLEIYLGAVAPEDFADGMTRQIAPLLASTTFRAPQARRSVLDTTRAGAEDDLLIIGLVDNWSVHHGDGSSEVRISGRDLRGLLLDAQLTSQQMNAIDLKQPIHKVVEQIVQTIPLGKKIIVETDPYEWGYEIGFRGIKSLIPSPAALENVTRNRKKANGKDTRSKPPGNSQTLKMWDMITNYCFIVGAIPFFRGQKLIIRPVRSLYDIQKKGGAGPQLNVSSPGNVTYRSSVKTPFKDGKKRTIERDGQGKYETPIRLLVYGHDVKDLSIERKYMLTKRPTVRVVGTDTSSAIRGVGRVLEAFSPSRRPGQTPHQKKAVKGAKANTDAPSGRVEQETIITVAYAGISNKEQLAAIADAIYEEMGRGEMGGSCETRSLSSFGGSNSDPDLLHIRPGDPIKLEIDIRTLSDKAPIVSELTQHEQRSFEEETRELAQKLGDANLARVIVATARSSVYEVQQYFRVANVRYTWAVNSLGISFDFQNYVEVKAGVVESTGENVLSDPLHKGRSIAAG